MSGDQSKRPEWVPENGGEKFTTTVLSGAAEEHDGLSTKKSKTSSKVPHRAMPQRRRLSIDEYVKGVLDGDRTIVARAITLVESNAASHFELAQEMLKKLLPYTGNSMRVGVTGVPGAGKSTFIECLGNQLCDRGHHVAVLAIDPSSRLTGGSILGDKTRMETLGRRLEAFIRPSPTGGTLGGVTRKSRETLLICEAAGYDIILVETVGVGQSEVTVRSMVDFFLLLLIAGAGDDLQGMKRGVMELADAVAVNKADGDNKIKSLAARADFQRILHYLQPATPGWSTQAHACSARSGEGVAEIWSMIEDFRQQTSASGIFEKRRRTQTMEWVYTMAKEYLERTFFENKDVKKCLASVEREVLEGDLAPTQAVQILIDRFEGK